MEQPIMGGTARWEVIFWNKKHKRFTVMEFDNDMASAEELYAKAVAAGKPLATLRCCNVGFPPPTKYRPRVVKKVKKERVRGRIKKTIVEVDVEPMSELNLQGVWWCPYCRKMRKFRNQDGFTYTHGDKDYWVDARGMYCPVCEISHTNHHVRKWNPHAARMSYRPEKRTRTRRTTRAKRTQRTRR